MIFAHELTHALQDETPAPRPAAEGPQGQRRSRPRAREPPRGRGDPRHDPRHARGARRRRRAAEIEDSLAPLLSAGALEKANVPKDLPDYFVEQLFFPYVDGTAYVRRLVKSGGWAAIDRLWKNPPASTSEILHEGAAFIPAENLLFACRGPSESARVSRPLYSDTIGEWGDPVSPSPRHAEPAQADALAAGWRGDRIAFFGSGKSIAYFWRLRFDTPGSADRFETAWKTVRKRSESVTRAGTDVTVRFGIPSEKAASNAMVTR